MNLTKKKNSTKIVQKKKKPKNKKQNTQGIYVPYGLRITLDMWVNKNAVQNTVAL